VFLHVVSPRGGGSHRGSVLWWYLWSVRNNRRFLARYHAYLRRSFGVRTPASLAFAALALRLTSAFVPARLKSPFSARLPW
jgi:hypothetical protein